MLACLGQSLGRVRIPMPFAGEQAAFEVYLCEFVIRHVRLRSKPDEKCLGRSGVAAQACMPCTQQDKASTKDRMLVDCLVGRTGRECRDRRVLSPVANRDFGCEQAGFCTECRIAPFIACREYSRTRFRVRLGSVTIFKRASVIGCDLLDEYFPDAPATIGGHCGASLSVDRYNDQFILGCPDSTGTVAHEGTARKYRKFLFTWSAGMG